MDTTRLSTKGQIILPKSIRDAHDWGPGTEFTVEETSEGVLLRPSERLPETTLEEVVGCLAWRGGPKTIGQMRKGIWREVRRRHERGRY
jgi:AbrB family looped-hinge helix DNA binding protein